MDELKRTRSKLRRADYEDRAIKNLKDGCNFNESRNSPRSSSTASTATEREKIFRTRIDLLSMHAMMLRSETMWYAELSDFVCSLHLENKGLHCLAVIQQITCDKTIRREDGRSGVPRWRSRPTVHVPLGPAGETPPGFEVRASWYRKKLIPASLAKPEVEISHSTQGAWTDRVFALVGIFISAILHVPRKAVARRAAVGSGIYPLPF